LKGGKKAMSVAGYLSAGKVELRMSRPAAGEAGAEFHGPVLRGEVSLRERLARDAVERVTAGGEFYGEVEEYDAVLRAHCGKY
jgi:hypothetical protein